MAQSDEPRLQQEPGELDILLDARPLGQTNDSQTNDGATDGGATDRADGRPQVHLEYDEQLTRVTLSGEIDLAASPDLETAAAQATALGRPVAVDVSGVTFMDSIGVGFIARLIVAGQRAGWRPLLRGARGPVLETLTISGVIGAVDLAS